ncbi:hypothetical protein ACFLVU_01810 [Chloroflexota bacterium]
MIENKQINNSPYISIIVVGRNDNYGGDFLLRAQAFINVLMTLCERHRLSVELIIVEWNPPIDNPRLADALKWQKNSAYCQVRIIEVTEEIHRQLPNSDRMSLFEYAGKNVGIRRARGEFVLATNPDIIFGDELIRFLASRKLSFKRYYRATRYDVVSTIPLESTVDELLAYCRKHITRVHGHMGSIDYRMSRRHNIYVTLRGMLMELLLRPRYFPFKRPFTNASGDFMLMNKSHWHALHGYPQVAGVDRDGLHHSDAFMVHMALYYGLKQVRLRGQLRIYHQEHSFALGDKPFTSEVESIRHQLLSERKPIIYNDDDWGLGTFDLGETLITKNQKSA